MFCDGAGPLTLPGSSMLITHLYRYTCYYVVPLILPFYNQLMIFVIIDSSVIIQITNHQKMPVCGGEFFLGSKTQ